MHFTYSSHLVLTILGVRFVILAWPCPQLQNVNYECTVQCCNNLTKSHLVWRVLGFVLLNLGKMGKHSDYFFFNATFFQVWHLNILYRIIFVLSECFFFLFWIRKYNIKLCREFEMYCLHLGNNSTSLGALFLPPFLSSWSRSLYCKIREIPTFLLHLVLYLGLKDILK